ncbi:MAG: DUF6092 family protein, partial [bacterium]|nr:DUF6092 family protein [bacterium]
QTRHHIPSIHHPRPHPRHTPKCQHALVTSARLNLDEKPIYGAFRMIEGASRLIEATEDLTGGEADGFLTEIQAEIEQNKARMTVDKPGFREWLAYLAARLATEAVTRNLDQDQ